ncbi:hypothetical protein Y032_0175g528, partial [Ancylostoma ceylanicum]
YTRDRAIVQCPSVGVGGQRLLHRGSYATISNLSLNNVR